MRLASRLAARSFGGVVFFCNSGAEANEAAIKLVRKARPRGDVIVAHNGVPRAHLRRVVGDAAGGQAGAVRAAGARLPRVARGRDRGRGRRAHRRRADRAGPGRVGREPDVGRSCWPAIRAACDAVGAALVFDEVQTGMGRTGSLWAYEQVGVVPDAMTLAKGLGGGLPIGALVIGAAAAGRLRSRRPRLDVRRRARGERGGARRAGHDRRRGVPRAACASRRAAPGGLRELPGVRFCPRARADGRGRGRRAARPRSPSAPCSSSG